MRKSGGLSRATSCATFERAAAEAPSGRPSVAREASSRLASTFPTREEIKGIVRAAEGRWRPLLLTAIFTGLRASELRGLRWEDVDFEKRELHVRQRADRYNAIGKPKSEAGERTVPLTPMVLSTLREWKGGPGGARMVEAAAPRPPTCPKSEKGLVFPSS